MIRRTKDACGVVWVAALLSATPVLAQAPQAAPVAQEKAAAPAKRAGELGEKNRAEKHDDRGDDKAKKNDDTAAEKAAKAADKATDRDSVDIPKDRLARRRNQQDVERAKIKAALRGQAMNEAMKQELQRHARRLARLERIKVVALEAKDNATVERVNKLIEMENARHDRFTSHFEAKDDRDDRASRDERGAKDDRGSKDDKAAKGDKGTKDDKGGAK